MVILSQLRLRQWHGRTDMATDHAYVDPAAAISDGAEPLDSVKSSANSSALTFIIHVSGVMLTTEREEPILMLRNL